MKTLKKVQIISSEEYAIMVEDLGARIQYMQIEYNDCAIQAIGSGSKPHDLYVMKQSVEWLLSQ